MIQQNIRNSRASLFGILLLSFLPNLLPFRALKSRLQKRVLKKSNLYFNAIRGKIRKHNVFYFSKLVLRTERFSVIMDSSSFTLNLRNILVGKLKSSLKSYHIKNISFVYRKLNHPHKENACYKPNDKHRENRLTKNIVKILNLLWKQAFPNGKIELVKAIISSEQLAIKIVWNDFVFNHVSADFKIHIQAKNVSCKTILIVKFDENEKIFDILAPNRILIESGNLKILQTGENATLRLCQVNKTDFVVNSLVENIYVNHPLISLTPATITRIEMDLSIFLIQGGFQISEDSVILFNEIEIAIELNYDNKNQNLLDCSIAFSFEAATFFTSYPFFQLPELKKTKGSGNIVLTLNYTATLPDFSEYNFNVTAKEESLVLDHDSGLDLSYLKTFVAPPNFNSVKQLPAQIENHRFTKFDDIPNLILECIILTEDPNFYNHYGIDSLFWGYAITQNLLYRKFSRGAGTITMQVARNLFLGHAKNLNRKVEEMILAWLIETQFKISKKRILEIYCNIIEFGCDIYGLEQAADHYFLKSLNKLTLTECLVLTYIIPRPKFFSDAVLSKSPQLINNLSKHIEKYAAALYKMNIISEEDFKTVTYKIEFTEALGVLNLR